MCKSLPQQYLSTKVVEKDAESVLHQIPIVSGNLRELNRYTLSVLPSSHKGIGVDYRKDKHNEYSAKRKNWAIYGYKLFYT